MRLIDSFKAAAVRKNIKNLEKSHVQSFIRKWHLSVTVEVKQRSGGPR